MNDFINAMFEICAGIFIITNIIKIRQDKQVRGFYPLVSLFFVIWGTWTLYYYPSLNQWISFYGGLLVTTANAIWFIMALYYRKN